MNVLFLIAALPVYYYDMAGREYPLESGQEIHIQQNKLRLDPRPPGTISVVDALGRDVVDHIEDNIVYLKAKEISGYICGPMVVVSGKEIFTFRIRSHVSNASCVHQ